MSKFCLLSDPDQYVPQDHDLVNDAAAREYWLNLYTDHIDGVLSSAHGHYGRPATRRVEAARKQFHETVQRLRTEPASLPGGKLNGISLSRMRETCLRDHNIGDPFARVKRDATNAAIDIYPQVVRKLHALDGADRWLHLVESVFAGNAFDVGTPTATAALADGSDFLSILEQTRPRPWLVDDFDELLVGLEAGPPPRWSRAVLFVDNAGADFVLGVMPLARELALAGTMVVLAANQLPSLNDITVDEAVDVVEQLAATDSDLQALIEGGMFEIVSTGSDIPLIDLSDVSDELNDASADADLVVFVGMGRCIESNLDVQLTVDAASLALLKDPHVAAQIGGEPFDCVCRYVKADAGS